MELVTGKGATDHVSSADMASLYRGILIADDVVLDSGDKLSCTMLDANTAEIGTGDCLLQGHHARVDVAEQLTIKSGSVGFNSNDLIAVRYSLGDGNIQAAQLVVLEGEAVAGEPDDPTLVSGDIDGGSTVVEFALWRIPKRGITVNTPERIMPTVDTLQSQITGVRESVAYHVETLAKSVNLVNGTRQSVTYSVPSIDGYSPLIVTICSNGWRSNATVSMSYYNLNPDRIGFGTAVVLVESRTTEDDVNISIDILYVKTSSVTRHWQQV